MDWHRIITEDGRILKRIAATLVALAVLADSIGGRSTFVRLYVFWLLCRCERVVRAFAVEMGVVSPLDDPDNLENGSEFEWLAASFRALAIALDRAGCHMIRVARWRTTQLVDSVDERGVQPSIARLMRAAHALPCPDTS